MLASEPKRRTHLVLCRIQNSCSKTHHDVASDKHSPDPCVGRERRDDWKQDMVRGSNQDTMPC